MKRILLTLLVLIPLTVTGAIEQFRAEWDPLPQEQTVQLECEINGTWTVLGNAPGNGNIVFDLDGNPGQQIPCRAFTTLAGFPDSPRSEVAVAFFPLGAPENLRIQVVQ